MLAMQEDAAAGCALMPIGSCTALSAAGLVFVNICVGFLNLQTKRSSCQSPTPDMADAPLLPSSSSTVAHSGFPGKSFPSVSLLSHRGALLSGHRHPQGSQVRWDGKQRRKRNVWECALFYRASQVAPGAKNPPVNARDVGSIPGSGRSLERGMAFFSLEFSSLRRLLLLRT